MQINSEMCCQDRETASRPERDLFCSALRIVAGNKQTEDYLNIDSSISRKTIEKCVLNGN